MLIAVLHSKDASIVMRVAELMALMDRSRKALVSIPKADADVYVQIAREKLVRFGHDPDDIIHYDQEAWVTPHGLRVMEELTPESWKAATH